ncbi:MULTISPECIES: hypothetical protein [Crateriforma]|uniref:Uncharacterized protein n=1 Tax=Crateriforma conspicua TaxID=2527996 RepID=A0A5C6FR78_9PLAN|nr:MULTISPECIES: hypothetical protein [Crateriforma]QDV65815.1 hypothetical protein Mal65_49880 [Crateriforma conspicua]TWT71215.1 hypothetical protein Pan14r_35250 [Crateriforma conspicua]TWU64851.1 hypothetical protein V7x_03950 [Crateriforma conspicua]
MTTTLVTDLGHCQRCGTTAYRERRRWYEKLMLVKAVYGCHQCERRLKKYWFWPFNW